MHIQSQSKFWDDWSWKSILFSNLNYWKKVHTEFKNIEHIFKNLSLQQNTLNTLYFKDWIITYHNCIFSILMKVFKLSLSKTHVISAPRVNNPIIQESVRLRLISINIRKFLILLLAIKVVWFFRSFTTLFFLFLVAIKFLVTIDAT